MRDGKSLAADVYLPPAAGRYPAILIQTPYDRRRLGAVHAKGEGGGGLYDRAHYAYVVVDWRGFYGSKEAAQGVRRPDRGLDGHDCVEWAAAQAWCDGKVGTWGPSALGKIQYDTAATHPPHLVCIVPVIAAMGQRASFYYAGGVLRESHVGTLDLLGFGVGALVRGARDPDAPIWGIVERRTRRPEAIDVPVLCITGWWDHFPDEILADWAALRTRGGPRTRGAAWCLVGPWDHMSVDRAAQGDLVFPAAAGEAERVTRAFFDRHLRGVENSWEATPPIRYWRIGEEGWTHADAWPGVGVTGETRHLHADGSIRPEPPGAPNPEAPGTRPLRGNPERPVPTLGGANLPPLRHGPVDQAPLLARDDVLVYETPPLLAPLALAGNVEVAVHATADAPDFDLAVRLCDVGPDGRSLLLTDGIQRASAAPPPPSAGAPRALRVRLPILAVTFPAGHRLRLILATSNWPRFERNTHTGVPAWDSAAARPVVVTLHHSPAHPATLHLPVVAPSQRR